MKNRKLFINNAITCHHKIGHPTKKEALIFADQVSKKFGIELRVYRCLFCGEWHKTKKKKKPRKGGLL